MKNTNAKELHRIGKAAEKITFPQLSAVYQDPHNYPVGVAYLDKQYVPISQAKISVLDQGFLHSDATYDVMHAWKGRLFRPELYLERFFTGLDKLQMSIAYSREEVLDIVLNAIALAGLKDAYIELVCTRGCSPTFSRDPREAINRFMVFVVPFSSVANAVQLERGLHIAVSNRSRISPSSVDPTVKNYHWLDLIGGLYEAYEKQAENALLLDDRGNISEGPGFNVFVVKGRQLATPDYSVLLGITRRSVMDICQLKELNCCARAITVSELIAADEVFITSTAGGVMPVTKINQSLVGDGQVGAITKEIKQMYWDKHASDDWSMAINYPSGE
ncbi:MAG: branched-chain amino acid aminotransferase [Oceanospirillaceae bacterium]|jgi:branched-chain amino acid aminotransferase